MTRVTISYDAVVEWLRAFAAVMAEQKDYLTELDSAIGDADHGINMNRGMQAVLGKLDAQPNGDVGALFKTAGMTLVSTVGGAAGKAELTAEDWTAALSAAVMGVQARGKAEPGDKTMVDALIPARDAFAAAAADGASLQDALRRAAAAAEDGMKATIPWVARKGRASYLGERSAGHQDPGATSSYLLMQTAADTWAGDAGGS